MLKINEIFGPTIQGEGPSTGKEVMFLRLSTCNLHCFRCDTPYTWHYDDKHPHVDGVVHSKEKELHTVNEWEIAEQLKNLGGEKVKALVISGGEPLLQQKALLPLIRSLKEIGWWIEVETNGTIVPLPEFVELVDQINCSPKLGGSFSGESLQTRIKKMALTSLSLLEKVAFKFVIAEPQNMEELIGLIDQFHMNKDRIYLMPEGRVIEEIQAKKSFVLELCEKNGLKFSTRLHVELWGNKRAV